MADIYPQRDRDLAALLGIHTARVRRHLTVSTQNHVNLGQPQTVVLEVRVEPIHGIDRVLQRFLALRQTATDTLQLTHCMPDVELGHGLLGQVRSGHESVCQFLSSGICAAVN